MDYSAGVTHIGADITEDSILLLFNEKSLLSMMSPEKMNLLMDSVADAMSASAITPLRTTVYRDKNSLMLMPSLADDFWGLKVLTLYPGNPQKGYPFIHGVVLLTDAETGEIIAMFNGAALTALRTGAVGGLGVRTLARNDVSRLGLIGAGVQGYWQVRFACSARKFREIIIYDAVESRLPGYKKRIFDATGVEVKIALNTSDVVENSDVVLTATNSTTPLFNKNFEGRCFIGIGSYKPEMREYPDEIFANADGVYVDTLHALDETGDLITPIEKGFIKKSGIRPLTEALGKEPANGTFVYKSVGGAEFDLFTAKKIFEIRENFGEYVEF